MISASDRGEAIKLIEEAVEAGARQAAACSELGLHERTLQRWREQPHDGRPSAGRPEPSNKLSPEERRAVLQAANRWHCASLTPQHIVPKLADEGIYLASESTFYRVLRDAGQARRRGRARAPEARPLTTDRATAANQVWCWDITWMATTVKGQFYYWYMVQDIYIRKLVVNQVHSEESAAHAARLLRRGCLREQIAGEPLVLHSDNGAAMKGMTMRAAMCELGVVPSFSRPASATTSPTPKHSSAPPSTARCGPSVRSDPSSRHATGSSGSWRGSTTSTGTAPLNTSRRRNAIGARIANCINGAASYTTQPVGGVPASWSGACRNWQLAGAVYLNPERDRTIGIRQAA